MTTNKPGVEFVPRRYTTDSITTASAVTICTTRTSSGA